MKLNFKPVVFLTLISLITVLVGCGAEKQGQQSTAKASQTSPSKVLIFTKTTEYRHKSIETGLQHLSAALENKGIEVLATEDASVFIDSQLSAFSALIFLNTTGDVLTSPQQVAMERYIQAGGGFVGIHAASDTEWQGDWFWYRRLVGGVFASHPSAPSNVQTAKVKVLRKDHPATAELPDSFLIADEWYDFKSLSDRRVDLMSVDENTYMGGKHNGYHPIAWYHDFDGGRSFYTGIGHNADSYTNPLFITHLLGGIEYAIGSNIRDYSRSRPEPNRFVKEVLIDNLTEPVSLDITKNGDAVVFVERKGKVRWLDVASKEIKEIGQIDVFSAEGFGEFGLLALALDPNFDINKHMYMMYNVPSPVEGNGPLQRVSRFTMSNGMLDMASRINMLDAPSDDTCCHTGGNMEFDKKGNLFIALGDNTNPFKSYGSGPSDFREGREAHDGYRSSGNTNDLRGKILRITPQTDGSYSIPEGNLFTDATEGKPEIYVMGTRNPYTIAFDDEENTLYYGDVGPDSKGDSDKHGSRGYDEINKVTQAGNFGWPLFIGNNRAYRQFDYATEVPGAWNNPLSPINTSPRNTGAKQLPPAQPAYIWYPYSTSELFPELGAGSRNALVAGVYRTTDSPNALPSYYNGGLFISDFMRRWIKVVFSDSNGDIYKIEDFAPESEFTAPIDLKFSHQGQLYVLEYGSKWHHGNVDARLSRVVYTGPGNRTPTAIMNASNLVGIAPLNVQLSAKESFDPDHSPLQFKWEIVSLGSDEIPSDADFSKAHVLEGLETEFTFENNGRYAIALQVSDQENAYHRVTQLFEIGNSPPTIAIQIKGNQSFIWPNKSAHSYTVKIDDLEDGVISENTDEFTQVNIALVSQGAASNASVGHLSNDPLGPGRAAAKKHLCMGCHQENADSVGPAFQKVADKYASLDDPIGYLAASIAAGSAGKWGQHQMPAHDFLSDEEREGLAQYVMLLKSKAPSLPLEGTLPTIEKPGNYELQASYTDKGALGLSPIKAQEVFLLRSPTILARPLFEAGGKVDGIRFAGGSIETVIMSGTRAALLLGSFDLSEVSSITLRQKYLNWLPKDANFEIKTASPEGKTIATGAFNYANLKNYEEASLTFKLPSVQGKTKLYLVATSLSSKGNDGIANVFSITFER